MFIRSLQNLKTDGCSIETFDYEDTLLEWKYHLFQKSLKLVHIKILVLTTSHFT